MDFVVAENLDFEKRFKDALTLGFERNGEFLDFVHVDDHRFLDNVEFPG